MTYSTGFFSWHVVFISYLATGAAWAEGGSPVTLHAGYSVQADDNLFRLPEGVVSAAERSDRIGVSTLGLQLQSLQGLQQFDLDASLVNYQYQNNRSLGYTAQNFSAAWHWAVTPRWRGNFIALQQEQPTSSTGDTSPNQQTQSHYRADTSFQVDGPWRVVAGVARERLSNQSAVTVGQDYSSNALDVGVLYESATGSSLRLTAKSMDGTYLNDLAPSSSALDTTFRQIESDLHAHWAVTPVSSVDMTASWFQRSHPTYAQRDFSGVNGDARFNWALSEKTGLDLTLQHELAAFATNNSNFSVTDRLSIGWRWQLGSKTQFRIRQELAEVAYRGSPFGLVQSSRSDTTRDTRISLLWQPSAQWQFTTEVRQLARTSNQADQQFGSQQISVSGQFNY